MARRWMAALAAFTIAGLSASAAGACGGPPVCTVIDPTGTPLNIRTEPNGEILGTWANGVRVRPYEQKTHNGKVWYAVERLAEDNAEGWVFDPYLGCEEDEEH